MTDTPTCAGSAYFLSPLGELFSHQCTLQLAHHGNHVCGCAYEWPRPAVGFSDWHRAHTPAPAPAG